MFFGHTNRMNAGRYYGNASICKMMVHNVVVTCIVIHRENLQEILYLQKLMLTDFVYYLTIINSH